MCVLRSFEVYRFFHSGDDETAALRGVDLTIGAGEFVALVGPSGSGKSTLLACLAGLDEPDGGHVEIMGHRLTRRPEATRARLRARHIGVLMQSGNLLDHLSVEGNMRLQMALAGKSDSKKLANILEGLGIGKHRYALPSQLSGGEAARAGLAVALAADPEILICDEPTAEVDAYTEQDVLDLMEGRRETGTAILVATHSIILAAHADRIVCLEDGRIQHG